MIFRDREIKVCDQVYDSRHDRGIGVVTRITENLVFPINVQFKNLADTYTVEGRSASDGPCYLNWPQHLQYLCRDADGRLFVTDGRFDSRQQAGQIMIGVDVIREIPESAEDF